MHPHRDSNPDPWITVSTRQDIWYKIKYTKLPIWHAFINKIKTSNVKRIQIFAFFYFQWYFVPTVYPSITKAFFHIVCSRMR